MHISETLSVSLVELSFKYFCAVGPFTKVVLYCYNFSKCDAFSILGIEPTSGAYILPLFQGGGLRWEVFQINSKDMKKKLMI